MTVSKYSHDVENHPTIIAVSGPTWRTPLKIRKTVLGFESGIKSTHGATVVETTYDNVVTVRDKNFRIAAGFYQDEH